MPFGFGRRNKEAAQGSSGPDSRFTDEDGNFDPVGTGSEGERHSDQAKLARIIQNLSDEEKRLYFTGKLTNAELLERYG